MIEDEFHMHVDSSNVAEALALICENSVHSLEYERARNEGYRVKFKSYGVKDEEISALFMMTYRCATAGGIAVHGTVSRGDWLKIFTILGRCTKRLERGESLMVLGKVFSWRKPTTTWH